MVVEVAVAVAVTVVMTKVMGTKVTATEYIAVGRLGCDIARIVISGYYLADIAMTVRTLQAVLVVVPLVVAVVAKDNFATVGEVKMATARSARAGKIHCGSYALQLSLAALRLLLGSQGGQSKAHKEEASSEPVGCHFDGCDGVCGTGICCRRGKGTGEGGDRCAQEGLQAVSPSGAADVGSAEVERGSARRWCRWRTGLQSAMGIRSCVVEMRNVRLREGQVGKLDQVLFV